MRRARESRARYSRLPESNIEIATLHTTCISCLSSSSCLTMTDAVQAVDRTKLARVKELDDNIKKLENEKKKLLNKVTI